MDETLKNRKPKTHWWDLNSGMRMLHQLDSLMLEYIQDVLRRKNLAKNPFILDAGCGGSLGGILAEPLARSGCTMHGIDVNKGAVETAREHAKLDPCLNKKVSYEWESIEDHCLKNGEKYDVVILNNVLHHVNNHDEILRGCIKVLKPGGIVFVSGTNKNFEAWFRRIVLGEMLIRTYKPSTFDWNKFINSSDVEKILDDNRCKVDEIKGIYYDYFSAWYKWTDTTIESYIMHAIKR